METIKTNRRKNAWTDKKIQCENCGKIHWKCQTLQDGHRKVHAVSVRRKDWTISAENWGFVNTRAVYRMPFKYIAIPSSMPAYLKSS